MEVDLMSGEGEGDLAVSRMGLLKVVLLATGGC